MKHGFTLLELSIVLVIIGLIIGGITAGQDLIRGAELNSVISEKNKYSVAFNTFQLKYNSLPGDMSDAEAYWGTAHVTDATCRTTASATGATCNGDGDGQIELTATRSREIHRAWQHLSNAELISGSYTGTQGSGGVWSVTPGDNSPESPLGSGGWTIFSETDTASLGGFYGDIFPITSSNNWLQLGNVSGTNALYIDPILEPAEAKSLDDKVDDGAPGTGSLTTFNNTRHSTCASNDTAATATYILSTDGEACAILMGL